MTAVRDVLLTLSAYWSLLLIRCTLVSFPLILTVMLLRRLIPDRYTWLRAWCWAILLPAPFFGKLHLWYDSAAARQLTGFLHDLLGYHVFLRVLWPAVSACLILRYALRARRLRKEIDALPRRRIAGVTVSLTPLSVSPFSAGLIRPRIVLPEKYTEIMDMRELEDIITHERIHIRLGHLWIFACRQLICALLFPDLLLFLSGRSLREDLEALCDRVTMNRTRMSASEYGRLILRSHRFAAEDVSFTPVTLSGERTYEEARRRILRICAFQPYRVLNCLLLGLCCLCVVGTAFVLVHQASYPRWSDTPFISIADKDGHCTGFYDEDAIREAVSWDRGNLTIRRDAFERLRAACPADVDPQHFWICFDGFYKVPGIGGGGQMVEVDLSGDDEELVIPYEWSTDLLTEFFRYI